jgi:hypothetical protein
MEKINFSDHALFQMNRRDISESEVVGVIQNPELTVEVRPGRVVFQSLLMKGAPVKAFLLRVFVDVRKSGDEVVTVYRTSKIDKYRS